MALGPFAGAFVLGGFDLGPWFAATGGAGSTTAAILLPALAWGLLLWAGVAVLGVRTPPPRRRPRQPGRDPARRGRPVGCRDGIALDGPHRLRWRAGPLRAPLRALGPAARDGGGRGARPGGLRARLGGR